MQSKSSPVPGCVRAELARARVRGRQLGRHLGLAPASIGRRLSGETPFSGDELLAIAAYLEIPVARLLPDDSTRRAGVA